MTKENTSKLAEVIGKSAEELEALKVKLADARKVKNKIERVAKTAPEKKAKLLEQIEAAKAGTRLTMTQIKEQKKSVKEKLAEVNKDLKTKKEDAAVVKEIDDLQATLDKIRKEKGLDIKKREGAGTSSPKPGFVKALINRGWTKIMQGRRVTDLVYQSEGKEIFRVLVPKDGWTISGQGIKTPDTVYEYKGGIATLDKVVAESRDLDGAAADQKKTG